MEKNKQPIGLKSRKIHDQYRALDIISAMRRYICADLPIPAEWFNELQYLYIEA